MVNAQRAMDASIEAVAAAVQTVGVIYPLRRQLDENAGYSVRGLSLRFSYAESGSPQTLRDAAIDLDSCDLVVLNSVGFTEQDRSEEHTSELQSLMRISYAVFCLKKKKNNFCFCINNTL